MKLLRQRLLPPSFAAALVLVAGCASDADDDPSPTIAEEDLTASSRALETGAVLAIARDAPSDLLVLPVDQGGVGLRTDATAALVKYRAGADGKVGTVDDGPLTTLAELEGVPYVASVALGRLRDFAAKQQVWRDLPADPTRAITLAQLRAFDKPVVRTASAVSRTVPLDCRLPIDSTTIQFSIRLGAITTTPSFAFQKGTGLVLQTDLPIVFDAPKVRSNFDEGAEFKTSKYFGVTAMLGRGATLPINPIYVPKRRMFEPVVKYSDLLVAKIDHGQLGFTLDSETKQSGLYDNPGYCHVFVRTIAFDSAAESVTPP